MNTRKFFAIPMLIAVTVASTLIPTASAHNNNRYYQGYGYRAGNYGSFSQQHPYIHKAALGGGAGALVGGLLAGEGYRAGGVVKGALIGAGAGLGYQYLKGQGTFRRNRW